MDASTYLAAGQTFAQDFRIQRALAEGDQLLFAGSAGARRLQRMILQDANVLTYVQTGRNVPGGWVWQRFGRGRPRGGAPATGSGA